MEENGQQKQSNSCLFLYRKPLAVNLACLAFLLIYSILGGFVFLHFEEPNWRLARREDLARRISCVETTLDSGLEENEDDGAGTEREGRKAGRRLAVQIVEGCVLGQERDERMDWNLKNAVLFGFGILTTLGYGKIEPQTTEGRLFTVLYGFIGVPFTVIIFTNFGRYLQKLEKLIRTRLWRRWRQRWRKQSRKQSMASLRKGSFVLPPITVEGFDDMEDEEQEMAEAEEEEQISPLTLVCIVLCYLLLGALLIDWLDEFVDFANGIYFAFLCLTAIEYGKLIPTEALYLPLVIGYICLGLSISTIALDIGSTYVKKLYYLGRKIRNIASIKIWFGAKHLRVRELLAALGHNIGLEPTVLCDLDLEQLISNAIQVKEGRLHRVPQTHMIMDGIWPPELVPLFLKDGQFPEWVDADERRKWSAASLFLSRKRSLRGSARSGILSLQQKTSNGSASLHSAFLMANNQPPERSPPLPPLLPEKLSVRFEEFVRPSNELKWPSAMMAEASSSGVASDFSMGPSRWSLATATAPPIDDHGQSQSQWMRRSETVPPLSHPEASFFQLCTFPSLEIRAKRPPLPPLTPLPDEDEEESNEKEE